MGEDNHWLFLQLCFYAQVLSLFTLVLDFCQYYYFQPLSGQDQVNSTGISVNHTQVAFLDMHVEQRLQQYYFTGRLLITCLKVPCEDAKCFPCIL